MAYEYKVSVLIPCYNRAAYMERVISHLLTQTYQPYEIIVVDDASSDNSIKVIKDLPVKLLCHVTNQGPAAARNTAFQASMGDILVFIDSDAYADNKLLESLLNVYTCSPMEKLGGVGGRGLEVNQQSAYDTWRRIHASQTFGLKARQRVPYLFGLCCSYKRSVFEIVKGFDTKYPINSGEDLDIGYRIYAAGYHLAYTPDAFVFHYHSDTRDSLLRVQYNWTYWNYIVRKRNNKQVTTIYLGILKRFFMETMMDLLIRRDTELFNIDVEMFHLKIRALLDVKKEYQVQ